LRHTLDKRIKEEIGKVKADLERRDEEMMKLREDVRRKEERWEKEKAEISTLYKESSRRLRSPGEQQLKGFSVATQRNPYFTC
jgi:hypothetical protein